MRRRMIFLTLAGLGFISIAMGQSWKSLSDDELLLLSRKEAYEGRWAEAGEKVTFLLSRGENAEASLLHGLILSWAGDSRNSERVLSELLTRHPENSDAALALSNVHLWREDRLTALRVIDSALRVRPENTELMLAKVRLLTGLDRFSEAEAVVKAIVPDSLSRPRVLALQKELQLKNLRHSFGLIYQSDFFSRFYKPSRMIAGQFTYQSKKGSATARVNHSTRFNLRGVQYEADLYPKLSRRISAYLNYGYSRSALFPRHRAGAELFINLPRAFEISGGTRYLAFANAHDVSVYTASVGKYHARFFAGLRGFLADHPDAEKTFSGSATVKYFPGETTDYLSATVTTGFSPDNIAVQNGISVAGTSTALFNYHAGGLHYERTLYDVWVANLSAELSRQNAFFSEGGHLWTTSIRVSIRRRF